MNICIRVDAGMQCGVLETLAGIVVQYCVRRHDVERGNSKEKIRDCSIPNTAMDPVALLCLTVPEADEDISRQQHSC